MEPIPYLDSYLRSILERTRVIAMVGASTNIRRPSYFAFKYLRERGYRVIPVNPPAAGTDLLGETVMAELESIDVPVDMVDVFRRSEEALAITESAIRIGAKTVWMQLGIRNDEAAACAEAAGLDVVMNRCPKIEYGRLYGELGWGGINSGLFSNRRRPLRSRTKLT
ncbi:MAG: CoA-binding protein [Rhodospirillales bacterium]|nr:CoA-binding protein [Rhodospirillales bacterium]